VDPPSVSGHQLSFPSESHLFLFLFYRQCSGRHVVVVVIFNLLAQQKKMMQFLNWNFGFFFLVFRVDWVNYYICRETGGRVIDDWAKVSCPSIGSWPAKQAGTREKIFFYFLSFFYLKILFVEKRTRESGCLIFLIFGWRVYYCGVLFHDSGCFG
jgi:hypothetical protein